MGGAAGPIICVKRRWYAGSAGEKEISTWRCFTREFQFSLAADLARRGRRSWCVLRRSTGMGSFVNFPWESVLKDLARRVKSSLARPGSVVLRRQNCGEPDEVYITEDMRDKAYNICREFLSGTWKSISSSDMVFKSVSGGLSNLLYYCSLPETHTPLYGEPSQVLMRMYGQIHSEGGESTVTESVICTLLSERNLGPKLYGVFPGGRLEEYIPARALTIEQLKDPEISLLIAKKLGKVHVLQAPLVKEPTWLFNNMQRWLKYARSIKVDSLPVKDYTNAVNLLSVDLAAEVGWLRELLSTVCSPIVFCHNDLQEGNILFMEGPGPKEDNMVFIDYEYCAYNYRGFDIGNHFCEWMYDYSYPEHPYFKVLPHDYPRLEHQREFVSHYLRSYKMCQMQKPEDSTPGAINTVEHVLKEAHMFTLASHLMWTLWSIFNAHTSKIKFGYWEYGQARLESYLKLKQQLLTAASEHQQQADSEATPAATT